MPTLYDVFIFVFQVWGGWYYLRHKYHTRQFEKTGQDALLVKAWKCYLIGTPGIIGALAMQHNWIFAGLEAGGVPIMLLGLRFARQGLTVGEIDTLLKPYKPIMYASIAGGLLLSFWDFGTLLNPTQVLEIGASGGFLVGSLLQAQKRNGPAYLAYLIMITFAGSLLALQGLVILAVQQVASFGFMADSYRMWRTKQ